MCISTCIFSLRYFGVAQLVFFASAFFCYKFDGSIKIMKTTICWLAFSLRVILGCHRHIFSGRPRWNNPNPKSCPRSAARSNSMMQASKQLYSSSPGQWMLNAALIITWSSGDWFDQFYKFPYEATVNKHWKSKTSNFFQAPANHLWINT